MGTGNAAVALPISSPRPPLLDPSPSNVSSPLSDVEDKDAEPDDMELDIQNHNSSSLSNVNIGEDEEDVSAPVSPSVSENEEDSNLSEVDVNDSEAETERLYDSPHKPNIISDTPGNSLDAASKKAVQARERAFQPSPSKLKQQIQADTVAEKHKGGNEPRSDEDEREEDDDNTSDISSEPRRRPPVSKDIQGQSPSLEKGAPILEPKDLPADGASEGASASADTRKRKRSPATDQSESDQPLRKRIGSVGTGDRERDGGATTADEDGEGLSTNPQSGEHSGTEDDVATSTGAANGQATGSTEGAATNSGRTRRSRGNAATKRDSPDDGSKPGVENEEAPDDAVTTTVEEEATGQAEDEHMEADADEETEAVHKNEEELERKKAAFEQLQAIEKHFATFRDRLYQERLAQLNQEEAMLMGDNPTHPEYLAMLRCIDDRRDEKMRIIDLEYKFNMQTLRAWAVARRGQIHGQYFQNIRESRERVLEDLGRQWYQIQQQRRRHANTIPDFGIRFPASKPQRTKDAIAYNKEVSILAGFAKYEGFPAAPRITGVSSAEAEDDLEEIARARQVSQHQPALPASFQELSGLSFSLGAAGQQYLADTPWANPNHPSHHIQRQQSQQEQVVSSPVPGPKGGGHPQQLGGLFSSSTSSTIATGNVADSEVQTPLSKLQLAAGHESAGSSKREHVAQPS